MKPGSWLKPSCLGQHKTEECAAAKNCKFIPQVQSEEHVHAQLNEHERMVKEWPHAEMGHSPNGRTAEAAATSQGEHGTGEGDIARAEMHRNNSKRLEDGFNAGLSTSSGLTGVSYNQTPNTSSVAKERMCSWMSDHSQPSLKDRFGSSGMFASAVTTKKVSGPSSQIGEPPETEAGRMLSDVFCEGRKVNVDDDPESFTCQRVRAYIRTIKVSCARTYMAWPFSNASSTTGPAHRSPANRCGSPSSHTKAPTHPSLPSQARPSEEKQGEKGEGTLDRRNGKLHGCTIPYSPDTTQAEQSLCSQVSDTAGFSTPNWCGSQLHFGSFAASSTPVNESETSRSTATPHPSPFALRDWEQSSPVTQDGSSSLSTTPSLFLLKKGTGVELADAHSTSTSPLLPQSLPGSLENVQTLQTSSNFALLSYVDSSQSRESSLILPQDEQEMDGSGSSDGSPGKLEPHFRTSLVNYEYNEADFGEFMILPFLSPIRSPQRYSPESSPPQSQGCSEEEELSEHKMPECYVRLMRDDCLQSCYEEETMSECTLSTPSSVRDASHSNEDKSQDGTDYEEDAEQGNGRSVQDASDAKVKGTLTSTVLTEPRSSLDEGGDFTNEGQPPSRQDDPAEAAGDRQPAVLDEFAAYEQDVLLVSVIPHDSELFENLPEQCPLKLGPARVNKEAKPRPAGWVDMFSGHRASTEQKLSPVTLNFHWDDLDITEEEESRPWRPQSSNRPHMCLATDKETRNMCQPDVDNSRVRRGLGRMQPTQTTSSPHDIVPLMAVRHGPSMMNLAEFKWGTSNEYCRQYFSDSLSCVFNMCRFQHLPVDGDEKFCVETVIRFSKIPMCLQKAGAVFTGYYQNNPPGVHFSVPVLMSLLWALFKAGMQSDVFSVLRVSLAHGIVPSYEFLLALFNSVREKGLTEHMPELMQLIAKMTGSGLDGVNCVKDELQPVHPASSASVLSTSEPFPEYINLAQSVLEIELCAKQEDWRKMGEIFSSLCKFRHHPNQVEQISGRIAVALLAESKDKLSLPFAAFADAVCQAEVHDKLVRSFLGRIGVSLMLRYHKTHQWAKGRRVVEVLSMSKVNYTTLKSFFGNENRASRCSLITKAAELLLLSGSVEGALNTLREHNWFLTSSSWPCEPADVESRTHVLTRLAEKTSQRDTLEVLCNLPGIQESNGMTDISRYSRLFNAHIQVCVDRQILPVASDTVNLMLSKNLPVDQNLLKLVLHKLGKQNLWPRAREIFRHSLSVGYYQGVSAPTGFMTLMVPCSFGDVELALTLEMFIAVNATAILHLSDSTTSSLSITLKRTQSSESEYLSAGSRLLSAAYIPQPSLSVQYTAVNASLEQVFMLDVSSARRWLHCNRLWANEMWMQ